MACTSLKQLAKVPGFLGSQTRAYVKAIKIKLNKTALSIEAPTSIIEDER
jgi:hypothetical protein